MPTAIFRARTQEGFVIAADGQGINAIDRSIASNTIQKIFPVGGGRKVSLAYSITGTSRIATRDENRVAIDFITRINSSVQALSVRRASSLVDYAKRALAPIYQRLMDLKTTGDIDYPEPEKIEPSETGSTIIRIMLDGYFNGTPSRVNVRLFHDKQVLAPLEITELGTAVWHQGPEKIFELMFEGDVGSELLSSYEKAAVEAVSYQNQALQTFARMAHAYISACSGPEAQELDPKGCAGIGGHIHIAAITPTRGFEWIVPPQE